MTLMLPIWLSERFANQKLLLIRISLIFKCEFLKTPLNHQNSTRNLLKVYCQKTSIELINIKEEKTLLTKCKILVAWLLWGEQTSLKFKQIFKKTISKAFGKYGSLNVNKKIFFICLVLFLIEIHIHNVKFEKLLAIGCWPTSNHQQLPTTKKYQKS
ncbi:hypothetical protein BpHYR1_014558 [Brachionus plicatilis]|uniref:Uncharacterized protein n=1 Tax=Brachionus plicatilis TaxID=10195 RepID=A0A3M7PUE3_BRAPC|nr:hypothetical protein BpHYR1_014558 [Brachionus plicatilis]